MAQKNAAVHFLTVFASVFGADATVRENVKIFGTTVQPSFQRLEERVSIRCPKEHPYPYHNSSRCCSSPWKATGGGADDCDGTWLRMSDSCCPLAKGATSVPCSSKDSSQLCQNYHGGSRFLVEDRNTTDTRISVADLDHGCSRQLDRKGYPEPAEGPSAQRMPFKHQGKIYSCGGRLCPDGCNGDGIQNCNQLQEDGTWKTVAALNYKRLQPFVTVGNEGLATERLLLGGGWRQYTPQYRYDPVEVEVLVGEGTNWAKTNIIPPVRLFNHPCFQQVSEDLFLLAGGIPGGGNAGQNHKLYYLYNQTSGEWGPGRQIHPDYGSYFEPDTPAQQARCIRDDSNGQVIMTLGGTVDTETWIYTPREDRWRRAGGANPGQCGSMTKLAMFAIKGQVMGIGQCSDVRWWLLKFRRSTEGGQWVTVGPLNEVLAGMSAERAVNVPPVAIDDGEYPNLQC